MVLLPFYKIYIHVTVHHNKLLSNNQPDINYSNLFCYKTLHVPGIFSAHHQEFSSAVFLNFCETAAR
jgi:hypothetical protein